MVEAVNSCARKEKCCVEGGSQDQKENCGDSLDKKMSTKESSANEVDVPNQTKSSLPLRDTCPPTRCQRQVLCAPGEYVRRDVGGALLSREPWQKFWVSGVGGC